MRHAKVGDDDVNGLLCSHEHVCRSKVAVHDALVVQVMQPRSALLQHLHSCVHRERLQQHVEQGDAIEVSSQSEHCHQRRHELGGEPRTATAVTWMWTAMSNAMSMDHL